MFLANYKFDLVHKDISRKLYFDSIQEENSFLLIPGLESW